MSVKLSFKIPALKSVFLLSWGNGDSQIKTALFVVLLKCRPTPADIKCDCEAKTCDNLETLHFTVCYLNTLASPALLHFKANNVHTAHFISAFSRNL